jgi:hypothetical protein
MDFRVALGGNGLIVRVVATFPWKTPSERLKPGVQSDGDHKELAEGMKEGAEVALAKTMGQGNAEGENDGDFRPDQGASKRSEEKNEGGEENNGLNRLEKEKGKKVSVETGIEILCETFPNFGKAGVHPAANKSDGVAWIRAVKV